MKLKDQSNSGLGCCSAGEQTCLAGLLCMEHRRASASLCPAFLLSQPHPMQFSCVSNQIATATLHLTQRHVLVPRKWQAVPVVHGCWPHTGIIVTWNPQVMVVLLKDMPMANVNDGTITAYLMITPQIEIRPEGTEHPLFPIQTCKAKKIME